jgi:hypothetical protein
MHTEVCLVTSTRLSRLTAGFGVDSLDYIFMEAGLRPDGSDKTAYAQT